MMMVRRDKPGPRPLPGPRYDCGRRRPQGDPRGGYVYQFHLDHGVELATDPKFRTQIGRLAFARLLTRSEVEAALLVGRIIGESRRFKRKRSSAPSPSYLRSFGDPDGEEDPENPSAEQLPDKKNPHRQLTDLERLSLKAKERLDKLEDCFATLPTGPRERVRGSAVRLCVDGLFITGPELDELRPMLDWIAGEFRITGAPAQQSIAIAGRNSARRPNPRAADRRTELDKDAWVICTRMMAERDKVNLSDEEMEARWREFQGLKLAVAARARFRGEKGKKL